MTASNSPTSDSFPFLRSARVGLSQQQVQSAAKTIAAAHTESVSASREKAAALSEVLMNSNSHVASSSKMAGSSSSGVECIR
jgi:conjugal transfer mating pair stabilization protein TraG